MTDLPDPPGHDKEPRRYLVCGGKLRQGEGNCTRPAGWGTKHAGVGACKLHGGNTPNHVKSALEAQAREAVVTYGLPVDVSPVEAILEEVRWTAGHVLWLRNVVQSIDADALTWGMTAIEDKQATQFSGTNTREESGVNVWLKLYLEERRHLVEVAATAVRIGIEERRVRLAEDQGQLLVSGLRWLFSELALQGAALVRAHELAATMLRALAAGREPQLEVGELA